MRAKTSTSWARVAALAIPALVASGAAPARNVDLSTVPPRASVELTIYNSEDLTLVRERRVVSFKRGANVLQFSWANTLIDPTSVELRFPDRAAELEVLDTTFPHDKPHVLYWNVASEHEGDATVEITYFTSGVTWSADYLLVATPDERSARLEGFVRVRNDSGEDYPDARVRLVVGTIHLVERIAALARVPVGRVAALAGERRRELRLEAAKAVMAMEESADASAPASRPPEIVKEGLSEYFLYTVEGSETIPDGWSKRLRSFEGREVPLDVRYRHRPREYGEGLARIYALANDARSGLGTTPLPDGTVQVFREHGAVPEGSAGGSSFLTARRVDYVAVGDRLEVNVGVDPRVDFELVMLDARRDEVWLRLGNGRVYRRASDDRIELDHAARVAGWDLRRTFVQRIRNHTGRAVHVEVRRAFDGDAEIVSRLDLRRHDFRTAEIAAEVPAGAGADLLYAVVTRHGRNAEQQRLRITRADVALPPHLASAR